MATQWHKVAAVWLWAVTLNASAVEWICSMPRNSTPATAAININDLKLAYSGQPVLIGRQWLVVVMLPPNHPMTRRAFAELGISAEAAERMASGSSLIDRGIRVVRSPEELVSMVSNTFPSSGYAISVQGGSNVTLCF